MTKKRQQFAYWGATGLVGVVIGAGGVADVVQPAAVMEVLSHLGYPFYFGVMLGVSKVLGSGVLVAPRLPLVKEWAYAGICVDLVAALVSHLAVDGLTGDVVAPCLLLVALGASWSLRPADRRLPATLPS